MKYTRPRAAIATGLCLLMAAGPVAPAAFAVDGDSAGQQRYEKAADEIRVLFDANGGLFSTGLDLADIAMQSDGTVVFPENPTREGYEFAGWTYDRAGNDPFVAGTKLDKHVNLYAQWTKVQEASVLFYANGGLFPTGGDMMDVLPQSDGTIVLAPEPTREGYEFAGWAYDADGKMPLDPSIKIDKHTTLFAQWKQVEAEVFAADFDANGGEFAGGIASMNVAAREDGTLPVPPAPAREGYEFAGWYYDAEGTQAFDFATKLEQDVKLYAKWIEQTPAVDTHKVTFSDGIEATEDAVIEVEDGKASLVLAILSSQATSSSVGPSTRRPWSCMTSPLL